MKLPKLNLSVQLILMFIGALTLGKYIPTVYKSLFLAISLSIKEVLLQLLPFIIFSCLFYSLASNQSRAIRFVLILLGTVCFSNLVSILAAYGISTIALSGGSINLGNTLQDNAVLLTPLWTWMFPTWI